MAGTKPQEPSAHLNFWLGRGFETVLYNSHPSTKYTSNNGRPKTRRVRRSELLEAWGENPLNEQVQNQVQPPRTSGVVERCGLRCTEHLSKCELCPSLLESFRTEALTRNAGPCPRGRRGRSRIQSASTGTIQSPSRSGCFLAISP